MTAPTSGPLYCYRHPNRETYVRCTRCNRPICPDCYRPGAVGQQCPECVAEGQRTQRAPTTQFGAALSGRPDTITLGLIVLCCVGFVFEVVGGMSITGGGATPSIFRDFAMLGYAPYDFLGPMHGVAAGEWYRLITAAFLHIGILHLLVNMYSLWVLGPQLERLLGRWRFLALYLVGAVGGTTLTYLLVNPRTLSAGASTAIYGLFAAYAVVALKLKVNMTWILGLLAINLVISFSWANISWQGHIGGLIAGGICAAAYVYVPRNLRKVTAWGAPILLLAICVVAVVIRTGSLTG